ncbi:MAG TPA: hypothetical protein VKA22_02700, partial [Desulfuromonadales bacterium]|nr:hypothetical protein [Desulfuromonadales bacterium]
FQLDKAEEQLNETIALKDSLKEELAIAVEKQETLQKSLEEAESLGQANAAKHVELQELEDLYAALGQENEGLKEELSLALEKHDGLQKSLEEAKSLSQAHAAESADLQETEGRYAELVKMNESLRQEFDQELSLRKRLERGASEKDRRISELEQSLKQAESAAEELKSRSGGAEPESSAALDQEVKALTLRVDQEKAAREALDNELQEAHKIIDSLEKMVRETEASGLEVSIREAATGQDDDRVQELEERLRSLEDQLQGETLAKKTLAKELATVEKKLAEQEASLAEASTVEKGRGVVETAAPGENEKMSKSSKPLPHEVRPAPKKGAFFRPDWDLQGLPCSSTGQVFKAWETVFNVQIAIEGYPSQYCMAFMVVLKQGKQKNLYLLYRLKQNKHTLICIPANRPKNEDSLQKAIKKGLDFLRKSGFEMDEMTVEHIKGTLGTYCQDSD